MWKVLVTVKQCEFKADEFTKRIAENDVMSALSRVLEERGVYMETPGMREKFCKAIIEGSNAGNIKPLLRLVERCARESLYKSMQGQNSRVFDLSDASERLRFNALFSDKSLASLVLDSYAVYESEIAC